jgi:hypothetical protein
MGRHLDFDFLWLAQDDRRHSRKRLFPRKKWSRRARNENGYAEWGTGSGEEVRHRRGTVTHVGTVRTEVRITTCGPSETAG